MVKLLRLWALRANHCTGHSSLVRKQASPVGTTFTGLEQRTYWHSQQTWPKHERHIYVGYITPLLHLEFSAVMSVYLEAECFSKAHL